MTARTRRLFLAGVAVLAFAATACEPATTTPSSTTVAPPTSAAPTTTKPTTTVAPTTTAKPATTTTVKPATTIAPTTTAKPATTTTLPRQKIRWFAGDSIANGTTWRLKTPGFVNVAVGGTGFINTNPNTINTNTINKLNATPANQLPDIIYIEGGTNDRRYPIADVTTAMTNLETAITRRGITVVWVTTPAGTYQNLPTFLPLTNGWQKARPRAIDCNTDYVRAAGTTDGIHPTRDGYIRYAACIDTAIAAQP